MLLGIEFDQLSGYDSVEQCTKWLQTSPFAYLVHFRNFHLRKKKIGLWISEEKRPVFAWYGDLFRYKHLKVSRPEQGIIVIEMGQDVGVFTPSDYPPMQPVTEQKIAEKMVRDKQRKEKREKKRKEQKEKKDKDQASMPKPKLKRKNPPTIKEEPKKKEDILASTYLDGSQDPNPSPFSPLGMPLDLVKY